VAETCQTPTLHPDYFSPSLTLTALALTKTPFPTFPESFFDLRVLKSLVLDGCEIEKIPPKISSLVALGEFIVPNNKIVDLPPTLGELPSLSTVKVDGNRITKLPPQVILCKSLKTLTFSGNPIVWPPTSICSKGFAKMRQYVSVADDMAETAITTTSFRTVVEVPKAVGKPKFCTKHCRTHPEPTLPLKHPLSYLDVAERDVANDVDFGFSRKDRPHFHTFFIPKVATTIDQGIRDYMEDRFSNQMRADPLSDERSSLKVSASNVNLVEGRGRGEVISHSASNPTLDASSGPSICLAGVYDGHAGYECAEFIQENLHKVIMQQPELKVKRDVQVMPVIEALKRAFLETDTMWAKHSETLQKKNAGSTAAVVMLIDNILFSANCGDARAVLCRRKKAVRITVDHKPYVDSERERIEKAGGTVQNFGKGIFRVEGDLAVSRAFGDLDYKSPKPLVTAEPYVFVDTLTPEDTHIIIASDGVWDTVPDQKAVDCVLKEEDPGVASAKLVEKALIKGSEDNICCTVVQLNWYVDTTRAARISTTKVSGSHIQTIEGTEQLRQIERNVKKQSQKDYKSAKKKK